MVDPTTSYILILYWLLNGMLVSQGALILAPILAVVQKSVAGASLLAYFFGAP